MTINKSFYLMHTTRAKLYPCLVKNSYTGSFAFRIAEPGKRDAFEEAEETTDIAVVLDKVRNHGYSMRAKAEGGRSTSSYRLRGRSIIGIGPEDI